ncbi:hypothetical protein EI94DRAFT_1805593 [Lactarius quietus]|nr:hypothetical protein EI94DRAFT_1805593 [Lactarius quietus]
MAVILGQALDRYRLHGKFTSDGAAMNRTTLHVLQNNPMMEARWKAQDYNMLCMEHSLHLAAKHFVKTIVPSFSKQHGTSDINTEDVHVEDDEDASDDDSDDFDAADSLGKAITLVKQICMSPQARAFFRVMCSQVGITPLELLLWIRTRWGSLYKFLDHYILLKTAMDQFILLADTSENVPNLTKQRSYTDYHLIRKDWEHLRDIWEAPMELSNLQQTK